MAPKVSVIITTYKRPVELARAMASVGAQTFKDYECIVVDDDPTSTGFYTIRHEVNRGLSAARNTGIKAAKGEYVVCLDDDNILDPDFLTLMVAKSLISNYDALGCGRYVVAVDGYRHGFIPVLSKFTSIDWGWFIKRSVFDVIQYDEELKCNEDADFGIQFHKQFVADVLHVFLATAYDMGTDSLSMPSERELDGMDYFLKKNLIHYKYYPNELRYLYRLAGRKFYRGGQRLKGLKYFWLSFRAQPSKKSFAHFFFVLFGWKIYNNYMTREERK